MLKLLFIHIKNKIKIIALFIFGLFLAVAMIKGIKWYLNTHTEEQEIITITKEVSDIKYIQVKVTCESAGTKNECFIDFEENVSHTKIKGKDYSNEYDNEFSDSDKENFVNIANKSNFFAYGGTAAISRNHDDEDEYDRIINKENQYEVIKDVYIQYNDNTWHQINKANFYDYEEVAKAFEEYLYCTIV